jgi:hypothetical protein
MSAKQQLHTKRGMHTKLDRRYKPYFAANLNQAYIVGCEIVILLGN